MTQPPDFKKPLLGKTEAKPGTTGIGTAASNTEERPVSLYKPRQSTTPGAGALGNTSPTSPFGRQDAARPATSPASPFGQQAAQKPSLFRSQQNPAAGSAFRPAPPKPDMAYRTPGQPLGSAAQTMATRPTAGFRPAGQTTNAAMPSLRSLTRLGGQDGQARSAGTGGLLQSGQAAGQRTASLFRKDLQITDEEFVLLRDFIYQQCGIFIAENRKYLVENRLSNRIKELNLKSYTEYYNFLRFDASRSSEMNKLFEVVTTNETSFFRNPPQLEVFQNDVLAQAIANCRRTGIKKLRIWSAGCSTGEEPYTLSIILHEALRADIANWDIKITANDLSEAVLKAAQRGIYNEYALRTTPKAIADAYFIKEGNLFKLKQHVKSLVSFGQINLSDREQLRRVERSQIVFCRNVIIYFDDEMKKKVINAFYDNLEPGGALLIGHSESLHNISRAFQLEHHKGTIVYRKMA
ncbi:MAG: chemotaxis protein CheR [Desulfovibrio sp.]|nr:chemotaxis protein CheR [Desulfovibrio sp.]